MLYQSLVCPWILLLLTQGPPASGLPDGVAPLTVRAESQVPLPPGAVARLGSLHWRTDGPVTALALAPNGKRLATVAGTQVILWDTATGRPEHRLSRLSRPGRALAFSPDGTLLAVAEDYGPVRLWDVATGKERGRLVAHASPVYSVTFSPDGKLLATGGGVGRDKKFCVWEVQTGKKRYEVQRYRDGQWLGIVGTLAFSPDGKFLAAQTEWGQAGVWDAASGAEVRKLLGPQSLVLSYLTFSADGKTVRVFQGSRVRSFDLSSGKEVKQYDLPLDRRHAWGRFSVSGDRALLASGGRPVRLWDGDQGKERPAAASRLPSGSAVALAADGKLLAAGGSDSAVHLWDVARGREVNPTTGHVNPVTAIALAPGNAEVASVDLDHRVNLWDRAGGRVTRTIDLLEGGPREDYMLSVPAFRSAGVDYSPDGLRLITRTHRIKVWDRRTGAKLAELPLTTPLTSSLAADGKRMAVAGWDRARREYVLGLWDLTAGRAVRRLPGHRDPTDRHSMPIQAVALTPDGRRLASGDGRGQIRVWDTETGKEVRVIEGQGGAVTGLRFLPGGTLLASAGGDGVVRLWSVREGKVRRSFEGLGGPVTSLTLSPDGRTLIAAGAGGRILAWEVASGTRLREVRGHEGEVLAVALSGDGRLLASGGKDTTLLLWDLGEDAAGKALDPGTAWRMLARKDAAEARTGMTALVRGQDRSVAFLARQVRPEPVAAAGQVARWMDELDSDDFEVRKRAEAGLARLGERVAGELAGRLERKGLSLEARNRLSRLLAAASTDGLPAESELPAFRAVAVLEAIGTPAARRALEGLAGGASGAGLTREAKLALGRLSHGPAPNK